jgi:hypothetical protein
MPSHDRSDQQGRTRSGLDPNERPTGELKPEARAHPEDFTRNTGAGGDLADDAPARGAPTLPQNEVIPSDSPGG